MTREKIAEHAALVVMAVLRNLDQPGVVILDEATNLLVNFHRATLQEAARAVCPDCRNEVALEAFKKNEKTYWGHQSEKGDTPLGYVRIESMLEAFENLSFVRQQLTDAKQQLEETKWECRNLEAENTKLRKCVEAADTFVEAAVDIDSSPAMMSVYTIAEVHHCPYNGANWSGELANYRAARAEVDK